MKLAIGSDHAGVKLKAPLVRWLRSAGGGKHRVLDVGTYTEDSCDYPDFAAAVAKAVATKRASRGILLCGTGIGMAIAANKVRGRARRRRLEPGGRGSRRRAQRS